MDKDSKGRFTKGNQINKGRSSPTSGRKPDTEEVRDAKEKMRQLDSQAVKVIEEALKSEDEKIKTDAAWRIWTVNHGKPKESMEIAGSVVSRIVISVERDNEADQPKAITTNVNEGDQGFPALRVGE